MNSSRQLQVKKSDQPGHSVVYVMSRDQRANDNHALLAAQALAIEHSLPLYVLFVVKKVGVRSREHYMFMIDGLRQVEQLLKTHHIPFVVRSGKPSITIQKFCDEVGAGAIYFDFSPLTGPRNLVESVAAGFAGSVTVVDTHNIIPAWIVSDKSEFAAHTMRRKVHKLLGDYLEEPPHLQKQSAKTKLVASLGFDKIDAFVQTLPDVGIKLRMPAGEQAAIVRLKRFISRDLSSYATARNDITIDSQSGLSPYFHFGQLSSLRVALDVSIAVKETPLLLQQPVLVQAGEKPSDVDGMNALFEEMIVRKELADNFCYYNKDYLSLASALPWAQQTLADHATDRREFIYSLAQWEAAATHDDAWNAAQTELTKTGKMHGYMRMYWAKKILEWSASPEEALHVAIYLNDRYSIDGNDPNGYAGILWSIAGLHDRPWSERAVFGKIRYMNEAGLRRKFKLDDYIKRVVSL